MHPTEFDPDSACPAVSELLDLNCAPVCAHFGNMNFAGLSDMYNLRQIRLIRPDGSCFYRAYMYRILEFVATGQLSCAPFLARLAELNESLVHRFYPADLVADFYDVFALHCSHSAQSLCISDQDAMYMITYFRCLTGAALRADADLYAVFLSEHSSIDAFCRAEVDAVHREADMLQITALTTTLAIPVCIFQLHLQRPPQSLTIPDSLPLSPPVVALAFKPGHYDLLYF